MPDQTAKQATLFIIRYECPTCHRLFEDNRSAVCSGRASTGAGWIGEDEPNEHFPIQVEPKPYLRGDFVVNLLDALGLSLATHLRRAAGMSEREIRALLNAISL